MKTIAVMNLGFIGDVVNASPVCIELKKKHPDSKLIFITMSASLETAKCLPCVDEVLTYDRRGEHKDFHNKLSLALMYTEYEWLSLYKKYCDKSQKIEKQN
jgi:ADP-heptose:LPS heptosyltransferase